MIHVFLFFVFASAVCARFHDPVGIFFLFAAGISGTDLIAAWEKRRLIRRL